MEVNGIHAALPPQGIEPASHVVPANAQISPAEISDVVEISTAARLAARIQEIPDVRAELVERVRAEIAAGAYETPERVEIAIDRIMEELFPEL